MATADPQTDAGIDTADQSDAEIVAQVSPTVDLWTLEPERELEGSREKSAHNENIAIVPGFTEYGELVEDDYTVFSASGSEYTTDPYGECSCMDYTFNKNDPDFEGCKHNNKLIELLNRGVIPAPARQGRTQTVVDEWMETTLYNQIVDAIERRDVLEAAQQAAQRVESPEHDPSDYADAIETIETILDGLRGEYERYCKDVNPDAPDLP